MGIISARYNTIGDCNNTGSGSFSYYWTGATSQVGYIEWVSPISGISFSSQTVTTQPYTVTGLTAGTYSFLIYEPDFPINPTIASVIITSSCTLTMSTLSNTKCGNNNGVIGVNLPNNRLGTYINLYRDGELLIQSAFTSTFTYTFTSLQPGFYYATGIDLGGCGGISNSVFVGESSQLDFGLYASPSSNCILNSGKIFVTGQTGTGPYTYYWTSNVPQTSATTMVTGLTPDNYGVTIYDSIGCYATKSATVPNAGQMSLISYTTVQPSCFSSDGSMTFYLSGGSAPYFYSLSNGDTQTILSNQVTFTGLSSGFYTLNVLDSALCSYTTNGQLTAPGGFSVMSVSKVNATCGFSGSISISLQGGVSPYNYTLSGNNITTINRTTTLNATQFSQLSEGIYTIIITDSLNGCVYSTDVEIERESFDFTYKSVGTTCGSPNGSIEVTVNDITTGKTYSYSLSNGASSIFTTATTYTFNTLNGSLYTLNVQDNLGCVVTKPAYVESSPNLNIYLYTTGCGTGSGGTITAMIQNDEGPFSLTWSSNVNGQNGIFVSGLTAGTYTLVVSGQNGCVSSRVTEVSCNPLPTKNYSFKYSDGSKNSKLATQFSLQKMFYTGYASLVTNSDNCILSSATLSFEVTIGGIDYNFPFYYTISFDDLPSNEYFAQIVENSILTIPNIVSCTVNPNTNSIDIVAKSESGTEYYKGETIQFTVIIDYIIKCASLNNVVC
jgi:hypothetical protein